MRSCRFSHCKVQNGSGCGTCVQFVTDYMISPCASWAPLTVWGHVSEQPLAVPAPHHYDLNQMLVNFPLWLWLTLRAWSASGSSLSSASSTAQRLRHQLAPARCFKSCANFNLDRNRSMPDHGLRPKASRQQEPRLLSQALTQGCISLLPYQLNNVKLHYLVVRTRSLRQVVLDAWR